jgi:hypothetical protein
MGKIVYKLNKVYIMNIKLAIIIAFFSITFKSCSLFKDDYCIYEGYYTEYENTLSETEIERIKYLIPKAGLSLDSLNFYRYDITSLNTEKIWCYQYSNNLKVFSGKLVFVFEGELFQHCIGTIVEESIGLDRTYKLSPEIVLDLFIMQVEDDDKTDIDAIILKKECIKCERGYWDKSIGSGKPYTDYIKAWKVEIESTSSLYAIIDDENQEVQYYENGIR